MPKRIAHTAVLMLMTATLLAGCGREGGDLVLSTNNWMGYLPLYLARDAGHYDDIPLHLAQLPSNTETLRSFRNGMVSAGGLTLDEALLLAESGVPICIPLIMDYSNGADTIIAQPGIDELVQLKGKRIGVENTAVGAHMLSRALEASGLALGDITVVPLEVHEHRRAFQGKQVDAVVTFEPVRSELLLEGGNEVFNSAAIPGEITDVLVLNRDYLQRYPRHISTLLEGWFATIKQLQGTGKASMYEQLANYSGLDPAVVGDTLELIDFPDLEENRAILQDEKTSFRQMVRHMNETMLAQALIGSRVDVDRLLCPTDELTIYH